MRLLIVDDHEVVRRGVRSLLAGVHGFEICGEAGDGMEALKTAGELKPEVVVMDVSMPRLNGLEATRQLRINLPGCEVVILSQHESAEMARQALHAGARGYVVKSSIARDLIDAVKKVSKREYFFDPAILKETSAPHLDLQEILQRSAAFEQALRQSEELYRTTFEQAGVGVAHLSPEGRWLRVNRKLCEIVGYSEMELLNLTFQQITEPNDLIVDMALTEKVLRGELQTFSLEKRYIRKDKSLVWVNLTVSGVRESDGKLKYFISLVEDISQRKQIEEQLRESQAQLTLALESSRTAMFDWDVTQHRGQWNGQMAAIYQFHPKDEFITDEEWRTLFHPEDLERLKLEAERTWKDKSDFDFEFRTHPKRGWMKWVRSHGKIVRDGEGKAIRMIGIHTDITERKQAELSKRLLAAIVDSSDDAILSEDLDGMITSWNRSAEGMFGYTAEEAIGQHITLIVPQDHCEEEADIRGNMSRGQWLDRFETVRQRKDGSLIELALTISPVRDAAGRVVGSSKIATDVTHKKRTERALATGTRQQKALFHLADELHRAGSLTEVYNAALNAILDALECNRASILLCDQAGVMRFKSWRGLSSHYRAAVDGHSAWSANDPNPQPVCIADVQKADIPAGLKGMIKTEGIAALAFIPLVSNGKLIGKFMAYFNDLHKFTNDEIEVSLTIARQLSFAIDRGTQDEALQESEDRFRKLSETLDAEVRLRTQELEDRNTRLLLQSEQLRTLSHHLLHAQDEERRNVARELHDSAGQTLAMLGISLDQVLSQAEQSDPKVAAKLEEVRALVQQLRRDIRTTSYLLHPPLLDESGLSSALSWCVQGLKERSGIEITLEMAENFARLPRDLELAIFRLVQECLTNVHRHSESKTAAIRLWLENGNILVQVSDQGKGIPAERLAEIRSGGSGVGIRGMQERMRQFGGEIKIEAAASGTQILAILPVPKSAAISPHIAPVATA